MHFSNIRQITKSKLKLFCFHTLSQNLSQKQIVEAAYSFPLEPTIMGLALLVSFKVFVQTAAMQIIIVYPKKKGLYWTKNPLPDITS